MFQQLASAQARPPPSSFRAPLLYQTPQSPLGSRLLTPPSMFYPDTSTGTLIFGGSSVESKTGTNTQAGVLIFGGSRIESKAGTDTQTGTLIFGGTRSESKTGTNTQTGTLIFGGTSSESYAPPVALAPTTAVTIGAFFKVGT